MSIDRLVRLTLITGFFVILFLPTGTMFLKSDPKISNTEKRELAKVPDLPRSIKELYDFSDKFENFYGDNFGSRKFLITCYSRLKYLIGVSPSKKVILGKDGWLFYAAHKTIDDCRRLELFTQGELKQWADSLEQKNSWLNKKSIPYLFVVAPNKHTIYPEYLPERIKPTRPVSRHDQLFDYLHSNTMVPTLDLRSALISAKSNAKIYFKLGTHWNLYGAAVAQYEIVRCLMKTFQDLSPVRYSAEHFKWIDQWTGDVALANMINLNGCFTQPTPFIIIKPCYEVYDFDTKDYPPLTAIFGCPEATLVALVFCDSFNVALRPVLSQYFKRITYIRKQGDFELIKTYVEKERPDVVIEEIVERNLRLVPRGSTPKK